MQYAYYTQYSLEYNMLAAKVPSVGIVMQQIMFIVTNVSAVACENPSSVGRV